MRKLGSLMFFVFLFWAGSGSAQPAYSTWSSNFSCPVNITQTVEDLSENIKFNTFKESFSGEIRLFLGEEGPIQNENGNYIEVLDEEAHLLFAFGQLTGIKTDIKKSKTDRILMIATGHYFPEPAEPEERGIAYLNVTGTLKKTASGEGTSIGVSCELGGGFSSRYVFDCRFRATLRQAK